MTTRFYKTISADTLHELDKRINQLAARGIWFKAEPTHFSGNLIAATLVAEVAHVLLAIPAQHRMAVKAAAAAYYSANFPSFVTLLGTAHDAEIAFLDYEEAFRLNVEQLRELEVPGQDELQLELAAVPGITDRVYVIRRARHDGTPIESDDIVFQTQFDRL